MSPGEFTTPMPWRAASPERGWTKPGVALGDLDGDARRHDRPLPGLERRRPRTRRGRGPHRPRTPELGSCASVSKPPHGDLDHRADTSSAPVTRRRGTARSARSRRVAAGRGRARPPGCRAAPRSARRGRTASASARPSAYGTSRRTSSKRSEKSSAIRALSASSPSPVLRGDEERARDTRARCAAARAGRGGRPC